MMTGKGFAHQKETYDLIIKNGMAMEAELMRDEVTRSGSRKA